MAEHYEVYAARPPDGEAESFEEALRLVYRLGLPVDASPFFFVRNVDSGDVRVVTCSYAGAALELMEALDEFAASGDAAA